MTRKTAGALVVVAAALASTACGSSTTKAVPAAATTKALRSATVWVPVTQRVATASGIGSKTVGTFAYRGKLSIHLSCTGNGRLDLVIVTSPSFPGFSHPCPATRMGLGPEKGLGRGNHHGRITITAPARVHWTLGIKETYSKPSVVPAGVQRLPLSRIGTGTQSLGTFAIYGNLRMRATCVGTGRLTVSLHGTADKERDGVSCVGNDKIAWIGGDSGTGTAYRGRATITVHAPAHMKWWLDVVDRAPNF